MEPAKMAQGHKGPGGAREGGPGTRRRGSDGTDAAKMLPLYNMGGTPSYQWQIHAYGQVRDGPK
ncbi:hypothetical protein BGE01nite_51730 [Brevifollis gellanilyticus]|uniref:Uncharacterized protein n=1 Tax=Brevifollis gellanilyticus TaxID=748831 RepID=A0A512MGL1_9BACT|nr:hypothetical protein BGE01nite_51730 [Brevifollis gellanilyticus]